MLVRVHEEPQQPEPATEDAEQNVGQRILRGGAWRVVAFAFAAVLGVVMTAVVSRSLGPADFALFTTAMSLVTIAISLSDLGLLPLGVREYTSLKDEERAASQRTLIGIRLLASVVTSLGIIVFAIWQDFPDDLVRGLVVAGIGVCAMSLAISFTVPLQATYRLGQVAALEAGRQAIQMSLMIVFAIAFANVGWLMVAFLPTGIIIAIAAGLMSRKLSPITPSFNPTAMRGLLAAAGTFTYTAAVGANYPFVSQIVADSVLEPHDSGLFSLAFRTFVVGMAAFGAAVGGAFALFVTAVKDQDRRRLAFATRRLTQSAVLAGVGFAVAMVTGARVIVAALGGPEFADAVPIVAVVGLAYPATFVSVVGGMNLLADRQYRILIRRISVGAASSLIFVYLLAAQWGAMGAASGLVVGELVLMLAYTARVFVSDRTSLPELRWLLGTLAIGAFACGAALLPLPAIVNALIAGIVYVTLAIALKLIPPELLHPIKSRLGFVS